VSTRFSIEIIIKTAGAAADVSALGDAASKSGLGFGKLSSAIDTVRNSLLALGLGRAIKEIVDATIELERIHGSLAVAFGPQGSGGAMEWLRQESDRLGLNFRKLAPEFANLAASAVNTKLSSQGLQQVFTALGTAATVLNLRADQTTHVFQAFQQMLSKGKVQSEELRRQLANNLPGAFRMMADALGVSTSKLEDMIRSGKVAADDALPKFAAQLMKVYGPAAAEAIKNTLSNVNRFHNAMFDLETTIGSALSPAIGDLGVQLAGLARNQSFHDFLADVGRGFAGMVQGIGILLQWLGVGSQGLGNFGLSWHNLRAITASVAMSCLNAWATMVGGLRLLLEEFDGFFTVVQKFPFVSKALGIDPNAIAGLQQLPESLKATEQSIRDLAKGYKDVRDEQLLAATSTAKFNVAAAQLPPVIADGNGALDDGAAKMTAYAKRVQEANDKLTAQIALEQANYEAAVEGGQSVHQRPGWRGWRRSPRSNRPRARRAFSWSFRSKSISWRTTSTSS
jgi:tape measure domain-containing protein